MSNPYPATGLPLPTVHLNGTSRDELVRQATEVIEALRTAAEKMLEALPNARDFYVQGPGAYEAAQKAHAARGLILNELILEYRWLQETIADGA